MRTRTHAAALAAILAIAGPAHAAGFTWASASDALSMDPQAANDVVSAVAPTIQRYLNGDVEPALHATGKDS